MTTLKEKYTNEVVAALTEEFKYTNQCQVPKLEKVVLNMGLGEAVRNPKIVETAAQELALIAGQKAVITRAKKPIANFKLRADLPIGCKVTLRREKMYDFLDRLINIALPRVRDFKGISGKAFDGRGNYSLGITEHIIFPEIDYDKTDAIKGLNVTVVTTAKTDEEGKAFLKLIGMPFKN
ncbi:50S ribosomal protein L5 [Desulfobacter sp. UBA2225]|jgi:large subunit ribosomal protein L5|uniref:50S ribosomal protein L5 n=1 Tax=Desulfobacter sp. UBA2225 TaxID=1961413 RepID=UPI00257A00C7|nr:50S ribosomal protein L5 [Desulfobacter sp. UBA2225]